ncbi:hypothetical protein LT85_1410 [Collimonas arenae]|uniref:Uncharacterized protein n=1 Tax=Collimonas arenae TaxID=279058 RepID=A0A0A1F761_9BURK|nr:hypothetical protein LT85_1410 [Collimonas arenae]
MEEPDLAMTHPMKRRCIGLTKTKEDQHLQCGNVSLQDQV